MIRDRRVTSEILYRVVYDEAVNREVGGIIKVDVWKMMLYLLLPTTT